MLDSILPFMRCPQCLSTRLRKAETGVYCYGCDRSYGMHDGILDMLEDGSREVITPFQRVMQTPPVVAVYEKIWRPLGFYLASSRSFSGELKHILGLLRQADCSRVLDLACGTGVFTRPLAALNKGLVVGFDLSRPMLRHARRLSQEAGLSNVFFIRGTVTRLPFIAGAFPTLNCCGGLHLFDQPEQALKEMDRIVRPGGHATIQTTIRPEVSAGIAYVLEHLIRFGFFEQEELQEKLRLNGFKILQESRRRISYTLLLRHRGQVE